MIRRGFWLAAGAVLGVAGYRRATRLFDDMARGTAGDAARPGARRRAGLGGDSDAGRPGSASRPAPDRLRPASTVARIGAAVGFARDVRDGVAEYLELHQRELARNLKGRSNRTPSG